MKLGNLHSHLHGRSEGIKLIFLNLNTETHFGDVAKADVGESVAISLVFFVNQPVSPFLLLVYDTLIRRPMYSMTCSFGPTLNYG